MNRNGSLRDLGRLALPADLLGVGRLARQPRVVMLRQYKEQPALRLDDAVRLELTAVGIPIL
ncbi:MAG: hypothetical protein ACRDSR_10675 [Pseudonocardiaceae bacterium]